MECGGHPSGIRNLVPVQSLLVEDNVSLEDNIRGIQNWKIWVDITKNYIWSLSVLKNCTIEYPPYSTHILHV